MPRIREFIRRFRRAPSHNDGPTPNLPKTAQAPVPVGPLPVLPEIPRVSEINLGIPHDLTARPVSSVAPLAVSSTNPRPATTSLPNPLLLEAEMAIKKSHKVGALLLAIKGKKKAAEEAFRALAQRETEVNARDAAVLAREALIAEYIRCAAIALQEREDSVLAREYAADEAQKAANERAAALLAREAAVVAREGHVEENIRCAAAVLKGREDAVLDCEAAVAAAEQAVAAEWEGLEKEKLEWAAREVAEMETIAEVLDGLLASQKMPPGVCVPPPVETEENTHRHSSRVAPAPAIPETVAAAAVDRRKTRSRFAGFSLPVVTPTPPPTPADRRAEQHTGRMANFKPRASRVAPGDRRSGLSSASNGIVVTRRGPLGPSEESLWQHSVPLVPEDPPPLRR
ncbi:hypothetical protein EDC01DRAFT_634583 [Geopyxis carbonaria]|nr:hypothetical protein EDC01DRAFT_634583 [Geopyxis carbonaria]